MKSLANKRGNSAYGYIDGITKDDFKDDAFKFREPAKQIINDCQKLITDFSKKAKI